MDENKVEEIPVETAKVDDVSPTQVIDQGSSSYAEPKTTEVTEPVENAVVTSDEKVIQQPPLKKSKTRDTSKATEAAKRKREEMKHKTQEEIADMILSKLKQNNLIPAGNDVFGSEGKVRTEGNGVSSAENIGKTTIKENSSTGEENDQKTESDPATNTATPSVDTPQESIETLYQKMMQQKAQLDEYYQSIREKNLAYNNEPEQTRSEPQYHYRPRGLHPNTYHANSLTLHYANKYKNRYHYIRCV
jgi:hypothetical protein